MKIEKDLACPSTGTRRVIRRTGQHRASRDLEEHDDQIGFRIVVEHSGR